MKTISAQSSTSKLLFSTRSSKCELEVTELPAMSAPHYQQRLKNLNELLHINHQKLVEFEQELSVTADSGRKFELKTKIQELRVIIKSYENEYEQIEVKLSENSQLKTIGSNPTPLPDPPGSQLLTESPINQTPKNRIGTGIALVPARSALMEPPESKKSLNWYLAALKKYAVFSGRARRMEYWMFALCSTIISIVLSVSDAALGTTTEAGIGILSNVYSLAVLVPSLAVSIRRLHDTGRSGWWLLISLTCVGVFVLLFFMFQAGKPGSNQYGPNPKESGGY